MDEWMAWMMVYGFQAVESVALVASLCFAALAFRADFQSRQVENLIRITESHRALWLHFSGHPELARVLKSGLDLQIAPVTGDEQRFVILLIAHIFTAFRTTQSRLYATPEGQDQDIGELFSLPIPQAVWQSTKYIQDRNFVDYVEHCVKRFS